MDRKRFFIWQIKEDRNQLEEVEWDVLDMENIEEILDFNSIDDKIDDEDDREDT